MITVYFAAEVFDQVIRPKDQRPYYTNLQTCYDDVRVLKQTVEKYRLSADDIEFDLSGRLSDHTAVRGHMWKDLKHSFMASKSP